MLNIELSSEVKMVKNLVNYVFIMKRKDFLSQGVLGIGGILGLSGLAFLRKGKDKTDITNDCETSPRETRGPFPNKTPADYVRENIIGDREGVPLMVKLTVLDKNKNCRPLADVQVDIWHCDSQGHYSEYGANRLQRRDLTQAHFLRGRQVSDEQGKVSFVSIFPGYYPGRAPHIHLEFRDSKEKSLLITQIAFPEEVCNEVYLSRHYQGTRYISNQRDSVFESGLEHNMADMVIGNLEDGFVLEKKIVVSS